MKRIYLIAALVSALFAAACTPLPPSESFSIIPEEISQLTQTVPAYKCTATVTFTASSGWSISKTEGGNWLSPDKESGDAGKHTIIFEIEENPGNIRNAIYRIACGDAFKEVTITQQAAESDPEDTIVPETESEFVRTITPEQQPVEVAFTASSDWRIVKIDSETWLTADKESGGPGRNTLTFMAAENGPEERSAGFRITCGIAVADIKITQQASEPPVSIDEITPAGAMEFDRVMTTGQTTASVAFSTTAGWTVAKVGDAEWINADKSSGDTGENRLTFTAGANDSEERVAVFRITCGVATADITFTQLAAGGTKRVYKLVWDAAGTNDDIYDYDAQGRVMQIGSPDGYALRFAYEAGKITQTEGEATGKLVYTHDASEKVVSFENMNGGKVEMAGEITYDADGCFSSSKSYFPEDDGSDDMLLEYEWSEGNVTKVTDSDSGYTYISRYTFYTDQLNDGPMDFNVICMWTGIPEVWFGDYFGPRSRNLVHTYLNPEGLETTYRYVRDADGDVSEIWASEGGAPEEFYCAIVYRKF